MQSKKEEGRGAAGSQTIVTARRALGMTKMYVAITIFFAVLATLAWNPVLYASGFVSKSNMTNTTNTTTSNAMVANVALPVGASIARSHVKGLSIILISVPLYTMPLIMLAISVMILFVYDKNSGVLEYMLSLGMSQRDIYKQYLKAVLLLSLIVLVLFIPLNMLFSRLVYGPVAFSLALPVYPLAALLALSIAAFTSMCMMAFSSLQKSRAGGNQPLGLIVGYAATIPAYFAIALPFSIGVYLDIAVIAAIALSVVFLLLSSSKYIRRENLLP